MHSTCTAPELALGVLVTHSSASSKGVQSCSLKLNIVLHSLVTAPFEQPGLAALQPPVLDQSVKAGN
jgi:hypothetical protein